MSLFCISDLHLSIGTGDDKSMEVFGSRWTDYVRKLEKSWRAVVNEDDHVVINGDISWGLKLEEAVEDLKFIDSLPGIKYLGKGNHDFWWATAAKMNTLFEANGITTLKLLYNNAYRLDDCIICGTRGWFTDKVQQHTVGIVDYEKIINRECARLKMSLDEADRLNGDDALPILVFLHFPPIWRDFECKEILDILKERNIKKCFFGHIHGTYSVPPRFMHDGIEMILTSADFLNFSPLPIRKNFDF